jgi:O-antigen/teichoic acid export membrane protein
MTNTVATAEERQSPSLRSDFVWTFFGNAIYAAGQFATLVVLAKLLPPEMVGRYALGLAIVYPVMMFTNLQLRAVMTSGRRQDISFGNYLGLRLLTTLLAFPIVFAITRILGYDRALTAAVLMVGLAYSIETISDIYWARLQLQDRMSAISKSMMARAVLTVLLLAAATFASRTLLLGILGIAVARLIVLFGYDTRPSVQGLQGREEGFVRREALGPSFDFGLQRELLYLSFPLGIVILLVCLNSSIPNFFIEHAVGEKGVGIFAALGFVLSVGNMAVVSLGQSAFTRLARAHAAGDRRAFSSLLLKLVAFGAVVGAGGILLSKLVGREILTILFRPEYGERAGLLPWIMAAGGVLFMAQFIGFGMTAAGLYKSQVVLNAAANLSLLASCYWLVPRQGLLGAVLGMLISAAVQLVGSVIVLVAGMRKRSVQSRKHAEESDVINMTPVFSEGSSRFNVGD